MTNRDIVLLLRALRGIVMLTAVDEVLPLFVETLYKNHYDPFRRMNTPDRVDRVLLGPISRHSSILKSQGESDEMPERFKPETQRAEQSLNNCLRRLGDDRDAPNNFQAIQMPSEHSGGFRRPPSDLPRQVHRLKAWLEELYFDDTEDSVLAASLLLQAWLQFNEIPLAPGVFQFEPSSNRRGRRRNRVETLDDDPGLKDLGEEALRLRNAAPPRRQKEFLGGNRAEVDK